MVGFCNHYVETSIQLYGELMLSSAELRLMLSYLLIFLCSYTDVTETATDACGPAAAAATTSVAWTTVATSGCS